MSNQKLWITAVVISGGLTLTANSTAYKLKKKLKEKESSSGSEETDLEVLPEDLDRAWLELSKKWHGKKISEILEEVVNPTINS